MSDLFPNIEFPEIFIGFVAPIGVNIDDVIECYSSYFKENNYRVVNIRITKSFKLLSRQIIPDQELSDKTLEEKYRTYISYGNQLRKSFEMPEVLAYLTVSEIARKRDELYKKDKAALKDAYSKTVFLIRQFKRNEEIEFMRSIYGRAFIQVSVYSRRGARVDYLSRKMANSINDSGITKYRSSAEELVSIDENEKAEYGQKVGDIFHNADVIINMDMEEMTYSEQVSRFCELLFSANNISPTQIEYGMYIANSVALRSLDLSRQVGAAIFSPEGEIVAMGSNEVPKAGGGTYWAYDEEKDDRDYKRGIDANYSRKKEVVVDLISTIGAESAESIFASKAVQKSQIMDALEYGRVVHAEMSAITDAARLGRSTKDMILYCTTFPCHMCEKHIIASGIAKVYFLEPYPKSLSTNLHNDSISFEGEDRGKYQSYPGVSFLHFYGITPRMYRILFSRGRRKDNEGQYIKYINNKKRPLINIKSPIYVENEQIVLDSLMKLLSAFFENEGK
ncbi:anti-phage dCTP deaminase [Breoghania sp. JC706]|uniref:anti-phage dCTP deaminase n=1 Tax=Breoghania sp. JC706 TaxID=3117732 RepID=UPI00300B2925